MPRRAKKDLTDLEVRRLKEPGLYFVGTVPGLILHVEETGARRWIFRVTVQQRRQHLGLGPYPAVTLAKAHEEARKLLDKIRSGGDPKADRIKARANRKAEVTFAECAESLIAAKRKRSQPATATKW